MRPSTSGPAGSARACRSRRAGRSSSASSTPSTRATRPPRRRLRRPGSSRSWGRGPAIPASSPVGPPTGSRTPTSSSTTRSSTRRRSGSLLGRTASSWGSGPDGRASRSARSSGSSCAPRAPASAPCASSAATPSSWGAAERRRSPSPPPGSRSRWYPGSPPPSRPPRSPASPSPTVGSPPDSPSCPGTPRPPTAPSSTASRRPRGGPQAPPRRPRHRRRRGARHRRSLSGKEYLVTILPSRGARASFADEREIDAFVETLGRFERGEIDAAQWQDGVQMLRVKVPQGLVSADQLRALADVAARFSRGFGHVTTRQNFQVHFLRPADVEPALRRLAAAGLTTVGAGGNAVRNVVTCPLAGVSVDEVFDPTPYAEALTRHFLRHPLSSSLPRKFKIALEGCAGDHVGTAIQDLGLRAVLRDGRRGFAVRVAGGTSSACTSGALLLEFLPAGDVLALAEAIVRVFHARGDRTNKQRNRLKFLVRDLGLEPFRALPLESLAAVRAEGAPVLPFDPEQPPAEAPPRHAHPAAPAPSEIAARVRASPPRGPGEPPVVSPDLDPSPAALELFRRTNVIAQRQAGYAAVTVAPPQGEVSAAQLEVLADLSLAHGDGTVRFASAGRLHLRWIPVADVPALHACLAAAGLARDGAGSAADVLACPGADACRMAVTRTRALARLAAKIPARRIAEALERLTALYLAGRAAGEEAGAFFARSHASAAALLAPLEELRPEDARPEDHVEPGSSEPFRPIVQEGECAA